MRRTFRFALLLALMAGLGVCVSITVPPERLSQYKRIGVLSVMGDDFQTTVMGFTVFGNEQQTTRLDIGADATLTRIVEQTLSPRFTVVDLSRYRRTFLAVPSQWPGEREWYEKEVPLIPDVVRDILGTEGLDAYVVITPYRVKGMLPIDMKGIGIFSPIGLRTAPKPDIFHVGSLIGVIDGRDFAVVARTWIDDPARATGGGNQIRAPNAATPATWRDRPADHCNEIRHVFEALMAPSLPQTLGKLGLIQ